MHKNLFRSLALAAVMGSAFGYTLSAGAQKKAPKVTLIVKTKAKPKTTTPKPDSEAKLKALDDACKATLANLKALSTALNEIVKKSAAADFLKTEKPADFLTLVDAPVADYYGTIKGKPDLHLSAAESDAASAAKSAQANLEASLAASPKVAVKMPSYKSDAATAKTSIDSLTKAIDKARGALAAVAANLVKQSITVTTTALDPKDITNAVDNNSATSSAAGAGLISTFVTSWTTKSAAYDAAIKAATATQIEVAKRFQDDTTWPAAAVKPLADLTTAMTDKSTIKTQGDKIAAKFYAIESDARSLYFHAAKIAQAINESSNIQAATIKEEADAIKTLIALKDSAVDSSSLSLKSLTVTLGNIQQDLSYCESALALITSRSASQDGNTMSQMVNLYYFTSVPEVMRALNANSKLLTDDFFKEQDNSIKEQALRDATSDHVKAVALEASSIIALRQATDALRKQQQEVAKKQSVVDQLQAQADSTSGTLSPTQRIQAQIDAQNAELESLKTQRATVAAQTPPDPSALKLIDQAIRKANAKLAVLTQQKAAAGLSDAALQAKQAAAATDLSNATAALGAAQTTAGTAKSSYDTALGNTNTAQADELAKALAMGDKAIDELKGFRDQLRRTPYWISSPTQTSSDPVQRCYILGYENANELYVRGTPDDVRYVKELVAQFDTPAPQARITLYNLQVNSADPLAASKAITAIQTELNALRGNMLLIQDVLRNVIVQEVQRVERVHRSLVRNDDADASKLKDRTWRSFFYPQSVRDELGLKSLQLTTSSQSATQTDGFAPFPQSVAVSSPILSSKFAKAFPDSNLAELISTVDDDLKQAHEHFHLAQKANNDVISFKAVAQKGRKGKSNDDALNSARSLRAMHATETGWLANQANISLNTLSGFISANPPTSMPKAAIDELKDIETAIKELSTYALDIQTEIRGNRTDDAQLTLLLKDESVKERHIHEEQMQTVLTFVAQLKSAMAGKVAIASGAEQISDLTVPDPVKCTTLGEMLMILSLGSHDSRARILHNFSTDLFNEVLLAQGANSKSNVRDFATALETVFGSAAPSILRSKPQADLFPYFPRAIFGAVDPKVDTSSSDTLNSNQAEIVNALKVRGQRNCIDFVINELAAKGHPILKTPNAGVNLNTDDFGALLNWAGVHKFAPNAKGHQKYGRNQIVTEREMLARRPSAAEATPRLSAANDMIKRFMTGLEADLEHFLVERALDQIRNDATRVGIDFGSMQKQSIITTNRLVARLDTSAVATVGTQVQQEALQQAQQLATILGTIDPNNQNKKPGKTPGDYMTDIFKAGVPIASTLIPFTNIAPKQPNLSSVLSGLLLGGLSKAITDTTVPDPEIYTVSSGGTFKLTPIFEPSGQALRFVFDYYNEVPVQGAPTNSASVLPRITRESIVTQVALSNLEVGQVATFESTTKAGHRQKGGGIPIIKSFFPEVPVLGYFWQTKGTPVRQYSVVFAQTTMYPTISDIMRLLVETNPEPYYAIPGKRFH